MLEFDTRADCAKIALPFPLSNSASGHALCLYYTETQGWPRGVVHGTASSTMQYQSGRNDQIWQQRAVVGARLRPYSWHGGIVLLGSCHGCKATGQNTMPAILYLRELLPGPRPPLVLSPRSQESLICRPLLLRKNPAQPRDTRWYQLFSVVRESAFALVQPIHLDPLSWSDPWRVKAGLLASRGTTHVLLNSQPSSPCT
ncbi:uncharacterized protein B0I36DRAFT_315572 [Microdochium trichocladiopsis]|uniref:Uncharacterized protein n=1 Tax=Microdochium trichocladiopsis TaxID=1682393 RepID=A0A9P8YH93_9PEZI|nr:uncharacterized protein B0I36DRAFT_315572 [Microdochium trichocladiopsis]KAH7038115.1 hypothetical protein B0I36DRAFT_315572 [Microdochium trichocladiopsis]